MAKIRRFIGWACAFLFIFIAVSVFLNIRSSMVFLSKETLILPKIEHTATDIDQINSQFAILKVPQEHDNATLSLSDTQLNLILKDKLNLENRFYVHFDNDDKASLLFSLPIPFLKRFANGSCMTEVSYIDNKLKLAISDLSINGILIDSEEIESLERVLENYLMHDKHVQKYLHALSRIYIKNSKLHIEFSAATTKDNES